MSLYLIQGYPKLDDEPRWIEQESFEDLDEAVNELEDYRRRDDDWDFRIVRVVLEVLDK